MTTLIDAAAGNEAASEAARLILMASLAESSDAVKGLQTADILSFLIAPQLEESSYVAGLEALISKSWYLHKRDNGAWYFSKNENLTKKIENTARNAPAHKIDAELRRRLEEIFKPTKRNAYKPAGFMRTLLRQRLCSSHAAGIATADALLGRIALDEEAQEELGIATFDASRDEKLHLQTVIDALQGGNDPKVRAVRWYLDECRTTSASWREMGCIIFSQYYDTAAHTAGAMSDAYPDETIALYAGADRSRLLINGQATMVKRPQIKRLVADRKLRLVLATDAACEGLNLQTLGTLINVDLPWNPSRLEQRISTRFAIVTRKV